MSALLELVRPDLRGFAGYRSARSDAARGEVWLNANEAPWPSVADRGGRNRRYPEPQPAALRDALAALYGCAADALLLGRGSDEAIDLLVRALCAPGRDAVVVAPPVFGMYAVSARLHGARVLEVPLREGVGGFGPDIDAMADAALSGAAKLVFLCSPGNPTGELVPTEAVERIAQRLAGRAVVVVDEAYAEFADAPSALAALSRQRNLVVLRTLSKAHALAGARIGCAIADPALVAVLRACQAPYPLPAPCVALGLAALAPASVDASRHRASRVRAQRDRLAKALASVPGVRRVYPSQANFLLVRFDDADAALHRLRADGIVVRDQRAAPQLRDALRISIGTPAQNRRVLAALRGAAT